jgi:hypothetical protein
MSAPDLIFPPFSRWLGLPHRLQRSPKQSGAVNCRVL